MHGVNEARLADVQSPRAETAAMGSNNAKCAEAPRKWRDCSLEDKIERLRNELIHARGVVEYAASTATQAHDLSRGHSHDLAGRVTVLADDRVNRLSAGSRSSKFDYDPLA